jgi:transcriptional regulator with XRE-family HTH domain
MFAFAYWATVDRTTMLPGLRPRDLDSVSTILDDHSNMMDAKNKSLNHRIAQRVRDLRAASGLSLEALASSTGVSRSMISLIERGESSPTAVVLDKLATGLGVALAALFETPKAAAAPVARSSEQPRWRDPESGYVRRNVTPGGIDWPTQIVEVRFPAGARVAYETSSRHVRVDQQVWILDGAIDVTVGTDRFELRSGDCLAFALDRPVAFHNRARRPARYAVIVTSRPDIRG